MVKCNEIKEGGVRKNPIESTIYNEGSRASRFKWPYWILKKRLFGGDNREEGAVERI
jgi:hypothetical protein